MTEETGRTYQSKRSLTSHVSRKSDANDNEEVFLGMATLDDIERKFKTISIQQQYSSTNVNLLKNFGSSLRGTGKVTFNFAETTRAISQSQPPSPGVDKPFTNIVKNNKKNNFQKAFEISKQQSLLGKVSLQNNQDKPSENSLFQRLKALSQHESLGKQLTSQQNNLAVSNRGSGQVSNVSQNHQQPYPSSVRGSQILNGYSLANSGRNMNVRGVQTARNSSLAQPYSSRSSQSEIKFQSGRLQKDKEIRSSNALTVNTELTLSSSILSEPKIHSMRNQRASLLDLVSMQLSNQKQKNIQALKQGIAEQTGGVNENTENQNNNAQSAALSQFQLENLAGFIYEIVNLPSSQNNSKLNSQSSAPYYSKVDRIFESFGIDQKKLNSMESSDSKEEYIVSQIQQQCVRQLSELVEKVQLRTKQSYDQEEKQKMKTTRHSNIGEYFNWIKLPSKHQALKKKLQQSLVEVLYGHGHIQELEKQNKDFIAQQSQSNGKNVSQGNSIPSISDIAQDVPKPQRKSFFGNGRRSASVPKVEVDEIEEVMQNGGADKDNLGINKEETWIEGRRQLISRLQKSISIEQSAIKQLPILNNVDFLKNQENLSVKLQQFQWNSNVEKAFEDYKNSARSDCVGIKGMNKWQSIGMQPVIQMLGLEEKLDLYREQLIRKFREEGQPLTEKEKLFIINTSELLNSNIDREHFQEILDFVSQDDINLLEVRIAENLLQKYQVIGEELKTIRQQYLAEKNTKTLAVIAYNDRNGTVLDSIKSTAAAKLNQRLLRLSVERTKRMLENKKETINYFLSIRNNPFVKHFARQLKRAIAHKEIAKKQQPTSNLTVNQIEFARRNYPDKAARKLLFTYQDGGDIVPMTVRQSQQIYHPNSRVLLGLSELRKTEEFIQRGELRVLTGIQQKQLKSLEIQKAKLINSKNSTPKRQINETHQPLFKSIYSNGPMDLHQHQNNSSDPNAISSLKRATNITSKQPWITQDVEHKAATIVQKWIRERIQHMKYKTMLRLRKDAEDRQMFQILKHWKESKELIFYIRDETKKLVANQQSKMNKMRSRVSNTGSNSNFPEFNGESTSKAAGHISQNQDTNPNDIQNLFNSNQNFNSSGKLQKQQQHQQLGIQQNQLPSSQQLQNIDIDHSISSIDSKQSYQYNNNVKQINQTATQPASRVLSSQRNRKERSIENSLSATRSTLDFHSGLLSNRHGGSIPLESSSSVITPLGQKHKVNPKDKQHNSSNISHNDQIQGNKQNTNNLKFPAKQQQQHLQVSSEKPSNVQEVDGDDETKTVKKGVFRQKKQDDFQLKQKRLFFAAKQSTLSAVLNSGFAFYPQDFNAIDESHNTPLYYVTTRGDEQFIQYLLRGGADVNIRCSDNNTALHAAFGLGQIKIIIELIDNGGDLNLVNNAGMTPLALGSISLLKELGLEKGATTVIDEKATFTQFDNNALFNKTHNVVPEAFRDYSGPASVIRKKREKIAEDAMQQEMINFEFVKKIGHQGENQVAQDRISVARSVVLPNKSIAPFVETFIPKIQS